MYLPRRQYSGLSCQCLCYGASRHALLCWLGAASNSVGPEMVDYDTLHENLLRLLMNLRGKGAGSGVEDFCHESTGNYINLIISNHQTT